MPPPGVRLLGRTTTGCAQLCAPLANHNAPRCCRWMPAWVFPGPRSRQPGKRRCLRAATCRRRSAITTAPSRIRPSPLTSAARTARTAATCFSRCKMPASGARYSTPTLRPTLPPSPRDAGSIRPSR